MKPTSKLVLVLCTVLISFGCADAEKVGSPVAPEAERFSSAVHASEPERQALNELTRMVALALDDSELRERVKHDLRKSRHTVEHKLHFSSYLESMSGGILLARMMRESGKSREDLFALLASIRPLEFYMPVKEHREAWAGGASLWVGSLLQDHSTPTVYTLEGMPVSVGPHEVPAVATLALVPVESDFSRRLGSQYRNTNDQGGTIGTYSTTEDCSSDAALVECDSGGGGGGIDWSSKSTGMYVTELTIDEDHEGALKGAPEFEIHLQAPLADPSIAEDIRCAGESAPDSRSVFNYDDAGTLWTGAVLVADSAEMADFRARYGETVGMNFVFWEDDDTRCEIKADEDRFMNMMEAVAAAYPSVYAAIQDGTNQNLVKALPALKNVVFAMASWLKTNDDLIGNEVEVGIGTCARDSNTFDYSIKDGFSDGSTPERGCLTLHAHDQSP